nr:cyclohexanone monooxygenase [Micromonospora sp. DSM 115978]
ITGPLSPSVLGNVVVCVEQHVEWISDCIAYLREHDLATIEATPEAEQAWVERLSRMASKTLMSKANSWYVGANVPGKPRVFMAYLGGVAQYRSICQKVADGGYAGFVLAK